MADFTKYELEKIKLQKKNETQKSLKAKKMFRIKLICCFVFIVAALFIIFRLIDKGEEELDDALTEDVIKSKEML